MITTGQEPGTASEIASFCKLNYGVTFPLADKTVVKGDKADPFYKWAGEKAGLMGRPFAFCTSTAFRRTPAEGAATPQTDGRRPPARATRATAHPRGLS